MDLAIMPEAKKKIEERHQKVEVALKKVEAHFEDVEKKHFFAINGFKMDLKELEKTIEDFSRIVSRYIKLY